MRRDDLIIYLDAYLGVGAMPDYGLNGLQVEGDDDVARLAFAVDACQETIDGAIETGAAMLIVHHGLFWGKPLPVVGSHRRRLQALLAANCSLYAVHLPLDRHPEVGNNAQLARLLGLEVVAPFGEALGVPIGVVAEAPPGLTRDHLVAALAAVVGRQPLVLPGGPAEVRRIGIISGDAARELPAAVAARCDTYITGEASHASYHDARESALNVLFAGHYATETVGLRALAGHLFERFGLPWAFIDRPTGL